MASPRIPHRLLYPLQKIFPLQIIGTVRITNVPIVVNALSAPLGHFSGQTVPIKRDIGSVYALLWQPIFSLLFEYLPGARS
jgi:hypothetical protein